MSEDKVSYGSGNDSSSLQTGSIQKGWRSCNCTLPPECCARCPNNGGVGIQPPFSYTPVRETVEEFDKEGRLIKRTVYERGYQWFQLPFSTTITGGSTSCESDTTLKMSDTTQQDNQIRT